MWDNLEKLQALCGRISPTSLVEGTEANSDVCELNDFELRAVVANEELRTNQLLNAVETIYNDRFYDHCQQ